MGGEPPIPREAGALPHGVRMAGRCNYDGYSYPALIRWLLARRALLHEVRMAGRRNHNSYLYPELMGWLPAREKPATTS